MRRILFLDSWLQDRSLGSGSAVAIAGLARGLESLGHQVTTLRPRARLPSLDLTRVLYNAGLARRLPADPPDLVVGFDLDGGLLRPGTLPSDYVVALKGVMADESRFEIGRARRRHRLLARIEARNARSARAVICTSEYSAGRAAEAYGLAPDRLRVVPEGIDLAIWDRLRERFPARPDRERDGATILSVARQYRRKNTAGLLRAFARLGRSHPRARLRIVGDGPELPRLRALAKRLEVGERVSFAGSLAGIEAVQREYAAADLFCLPSLQEGFGIVYLEAMAAGLPIVAARAGAVPEVAPHGRVSLLVDPGDDAALAAALDRLLASPALRRTLSQAGTRLCRSFDWPVVAGRFLEAALAPGPSTAA